MVRIVDEQILKQNNGKPFLLQVWSKLGNMVFERPMMEPCTNWNSSDNIFLFSEDSNCENVWLVKLSIEKEPVVFKFVMPSHVIRGHENSKWDGKNYHIPDDVIGHSWPEPSGGTIDNDAAPMFVSPVNGEESYLDSTMKKE